MPLASILGDHPARRPKGAGVVLFYGKLLVACALLFTAAPTRAEEKPAEQAKAVSLTPAQEEVVKTFLTRMREVRLRLWKGELTKTLEELKTYGLADDRRDTLSAAGEKAFAACIGPWAEAYEKFVRETMLRPKNGPPLATIIERLPQVSDAGALPRTFTGYPNPFERPAWRAAVRSALGEDAFAKWQEAEVEKDAARAALIAEAIKTQEEGAVETWRSDVEMKIAELGATVPLTPEQVTALQDLGKRLLEETKETFRTSLRKVLNGQTVSNLKNILVGRVRYGVGEVQSPPLQPGWKDAAAKIIGPEGMKEIAAVEAERRTRRSRSLGLLLIAQMDARVALTGSQRERLQPLAEALVQKEPSLIDRDPNSYFNTAGDIFITIAAKAKPEELQSILDPAQLRRWQEAGSPQTLKQAQLEDEEVNGNKVLGKARGRSSASIPREEIERELSDFFVGRAEAKRRDLVALMQMKAEDLARTGKLSEEKAERLEFAARGAAERTLAQWANNIEASVRASLGSIDPRLIRQQLAAMGSYAQEGDPDKNELWTRALKLLATDEQIGAWKKEIEERERYEQSAISQYLLAEFDLLARLTPAQWKALEPKLIEALRKHGPSIQRMFGYNARQRPWFLMSYSRMVPFHGIAEAEMKATLTKPQWDRWSQSSDYSNSAMYWSNIEQMNQIQIRR